MKNWTVHHLYQGAIRQLPQATAFNIQNYATNLKRAKLPVIFSLGHLSRITKIDYSLLHNTVNRKRESVNYNMFKITKRSGGKRFIHAVNGKLFYLQKFINDEVLQLTKPHHSSFAFHSSGGIRRCAELHCGCKWLFQFDLKDFFFSISESKVYEVFLSLGYKELLAFELTRLCTTLQVPKIKRGYLKKSPFNEKQEYMISQFPYSGQQFMGFLPQGAPSSPMLSNLVARELDEYLFDYSQECGLVYSRYADDITFSGSEFPSNKSFGKIKREVISIIRKCGFIENKEKIRMAGPGAKKVVLGLLVDGDFPRISRETYKRIDRNIYASLKFGLEATAKHEGFYSAVGFYHHISGLMAFIKDVDLERWNRLYHKFKSIPKPFTDLS